MRTNTLTFSSILFFIQNEKNVGFRWFTSKVEDSHLKWQRRCVSFCHCSIKKSKIYYWNQKCLPTIICFACMWDYDHVIIAIIQSWHHEIKCTHRDEAGEKKHEALQKLIDNFPNCPKLWWPQNDLKLDVITLCHLAQMCRHAFFVSISIALMQSVFTLIFHNITHERCSPVDCFNGARKLLSSFLKYCMSSSVEMSLCFPSR